MIDYCVDVDDKNILFGVMGKNRNKTQRCLRQIQFLGSQTIVHLLQLAPSFKVAQQGRATASGDHGRRSVTSQVGSPLADD